MHALTLANLVNWCGHLRWIEAGPEEGRIGVEPDQRRIVEELCKAR